MHKKKKKRKLLIGRIYDLLLVVVYSILTIITFFSLLKYTSKYIWLIGIALLFILAIYITTFFYNKKIIEYLRRIILTILCFALFYICTQLHNVNSFFEDLTGDEDTIITTQMDLMSLDDSDVFTAIVKDMDDVDGKRVAIHGLQDKKAVEYVQKQLNTSYKNIQYVEYNDYYSMMQDLFYGYVDVVCLNANQQTTLEEAWGPLENFTIHLKSYVHKETLKIDKNEKDITKEMFTVLISANDELGVPSNYSKSDANMLVMVDPIRHKMIIVSIPRDAYIANPAYAYASDKLTHTGNNGIENTKEAIENALGINVDFYVKVSFSSIIEIINTIGEIEVNVPYSFTEQNSRREMNAVYIEKGLQKLDGEEALAFARHRHSYENQDLGRNQAQVQVIKAMIKQMLTSEGITKIDDVLKIVPNYVLTNFSNGQLQSFIKTQVDDLQPWSITSLSLAGGESADNVVTASMPNIGTSVYYLNKDEVHILQNIASSLNEEHSLNDFKFKIDTLYEKEEAFKAGKNTIYYETPLYE